MTTEALRSGRDHLSKGVFFGRKGRTAESYELELKRDRLAVGNLQGALARNEEMLRQKDELIQQQELMGREADHRFLNDVQIIVSLLALQSRGAANPEVASQLAAASDRVGAIGRVHRRLHAMDGARIVAFKEYLADLCADVSAMMTSDEHEWPILTVEGSDVDLPATVGIPLAFVANELITNAVKHGSGPIVVSLATDADGGCTLSVANDGPALPQGFDPRAGKGLGMKIVRSFAARVGSELQFGTSNRNQGARFSVRIPAAVTVIPPPAGNTPSFSSSSGSEVQRPPSQDNRR